MMFSKFKNVPLVMLGKYDINCHRRLKCYYDTLGLTSDATAKDIKQAYYELSKQFHPDVNKSSSAVQKFRDISAAYEVLGNVKLRTLYDKQFMEIGRSARNPYSNAQTRGNGGHQETQYPKFYQPRNRSSTMNGRTQIYDFDEWTRQHYGDQYIRNVASVKARKRNREETKQPKIDFRSMTTLFILVALVYMLSDIASDLTANDQIRSKDTVGESLNVKKSHIDEQPSNKT